ncbi:hypothetical protein [Streptomyces mirabilis]|uniref:hypothetical protein n=1 Tax=Streptomyces mirabilis TaxID=68239 RepID=UPI000B333D80|nr:hypothetical protein [Streptomyces mirabilis]MCX4428686.1 hypothetical protein [Streptomyces mirabilis]
MGDQSVYNYSSNDTQNHNQHSKEPQQYSGGAYSDSSQGTIDHSMLPALPTFSIPGVSEDGSGNVKVDTSVLKKYADNLDALAETIGTAWTRVMHLKDLAPGGFKEAGELKEAVTGDKGLRPNYSDALHDLRTALMDAAVNLRTLATKYSTIEELNQKGGDELRTLITTAQTDLQKLQSDQL